MRILTGPANCQLLNFILFITSNGFLTQLKYVLTYPTRIVSLDMPETFGLCPVNCRNLSKLKSWLTKLEICLDINIPSEKKWHMWVIPCGINQLFPPDPHGFCWYFVKSVCPSRNENPENFVFLSWKVSKLCPCELWTL